MTSPLVSVIIPMHNAAPLLPRTLDSLCKQTFAQFEVIMVDDRSTDQTREVASRYLHDARFKLVPLETNNGVANARNEGITRAKGEYLCFLDADDWWEADKLATQLAWMQQHDCTLSYMDYLRIEDGTGKTLAKVAAPTNVDFKAMLKSNFIGNLTAMVSRSAVGATRFQRFGHEDYIFWLTILKNGGTAQKVPTATPQCFYLVRPGSLSSNKLRTVKWQWQIYRRILGLSLLPSIWYLACYLVYALKKRA